MIVVCDIDGTISDHGHRFHHVQKRPKNFPAYYAGMKDDPPIAGAQRILPHLVAKTMPNFFFLTGRPEQYRKVTSDWIEEHFALLTRLPGPTQPGEEHLIQLVMRPDGDYRPASIFKEEFAKFLYTAGTNFRNSVLFFDDDLRNSDMYLRYGVFMKAPECWDSMR